MQDTDPLPDSGNVLAISPTEAPLRARASNRKWAAAIIISCLLHAVVAAAFLMSPAGRSDSEDAEQSEGGNQAGRKVAGSALDENPAAVNVTLVPAPQEPRRQPAKPTKPVSPTASPEPRDNVVKQPSEPAHEAARQPPKPLPEAVKTPMANPDIQVPATPHLDDKAVAVTTEPPAQPAVQAQRPEMPVAVQKQPPVPHPRPTQAAAPAAPAKADEKSGTADGQVQSEQAASTGSKRKEASNASEDSYRGEVFRRLGSVNRTLPPSLQLTARNNAVVAFVIGTKGEIDELRILESSGSAKFDQAALAIVRKAAPFAPIPPQAGRQSLEFEVVIGPF